MCWHKNANVSLKAYFFCALIKKRPQKQRACVGVPACWRLQRVLIQCSSNKQNVFWSHFWDSWRLLSNWKDNQQLKTAKQLEVSGVTFIRSCSSVLTFCWKYFWSLCRHCSYMYHFLINPNQELSWQRRWILIPKCNIQR